MPRDDRAATYSGGAAEVDDLQKVCGRERATAASSTPTTTSEHRPSATAAASVGSGATSKSTSISPDSAALSSRIRMSEARSRSTPGGGPAAGSATGGWRRARRPGRDLDGRAVPLVALAGLVALGDEPLRQPRLLEHGAALGQAPPRRRPVARGAPASASRSCSSCARASLALLDGGGRRRRHRPRRP